MLNPCDKVMDTLVCILRVKVNFLCFLLASLSDAMEWHGLELQAHSSWTFPCIPCNPCIPKWCLEHGGTSGAWGCGV